MLHSVNYWMIGGFDGKLPVAQASAAARDLGYAAIELCFGPGELSPETTPSEFKALRESLDNVGLPIASLATGHYWTQSLSSPDPLERAQAVAFTQSYVRAARALGVDSVLIVPGAVEVPWDTARPVVPARQVYELSQDSLRIVLPVAEQERVTLCIENVWNRFLTGPFEFASFIDSFDSPWVRAYFDVGNALLFGYPEHWIEVLGRRIARVHFKNFQKRDGGGTLNDFTGSLLDGDVNWPSVFKELRRAGYDGYVTAEVLVSEKGMPDIQVAGKVCQEMKDLIERNG
jgi:hexulose-6-phosphate isomerase